MFGLHKVSMIAKEDALPGRQTTMPVPGIFKLATCASQRHPCNPVLQECRRGRLVR